MARPQQPELHRSGQTDLDPDHAATRLTAADRPGQGPDTLEPVPPDNRPGHRPERDQDQPPLDEFAARLGIPAEHPGDRTDEPERTPAARDADQPRLDTERDLGEDEAASAPGAVSVPALVGAAVRAVVLPTLGAIRRGVEATERELRRRYDR